MSNHRRPTTRNIMASTPGVPVFNAEAHRQQLHDERRHRDHQGVDIGKIPAYVTVIVLFIVVSAGMNFLTGGRDLVQEQRERDYKGERLVPFNPNSPFPHQTENDVRGARERGERP